MTEYLYPQNLKATANLWLWGLKDFAIIGMLLLPAIVMLVQFGILLPTVGVFCYGFLTIRMDEIRMMDFLQYAIRYFVTMQQYYEWR